MRLKSIEKNWEGLASSDPMWSILTDNRFANNQWDKESFFLTGKHQVDYWFNCYSELKMINNERALDFGCGMGRLTQALCTRFKKVHGVDISSKMIELAKQNNAYGEQCNYWVNNESNLTNFNENSFDFICSFITLQHIPPKYIFQYLQEFLRILNPNGILIFSLPAKPPLFYRMAITFIPNFLLNLYRKMKFGKKHVMEMHFVSLKTMTHFLNKHGKLLNAYPDLSAGKNWKGYVYLVKKYVE